MFDRCHLFTVVSKIPSAWYDYISDYARGTGRSAEALDGRIGPWLGYLTNEAKA